MICNYYKRRTKYHEQLHSLMQSSFIQRCVKEVLIEVILKAAVCIVVLIVIIIMCSLISLCINASLTQSEVSTLMDSPDHTFLPVHETQILDSLYNYTPPPFFIS